MWPRIYVSICFRETSSFPPSLMTDNLPTELINAIDTYLDDEELLVLAMVSKRLHVIAITSYMARHKPACIMGDRMLFLYGSPFPLLKPLRMALFIHDLTQLNFEWSISGSDTVVLSLKSLQRFIGHLSTLSEAEFKFVRKRTGNHVENQKIKKAVGDLLESLIGKRCSRLSLSGWCLHGEPLAISGVAQKCTDLPPQNIRPLTSLERVAVSGSDIHTQEHYKWLSDSMNLSHIRALTLCDVSFAAEMQTMRSFLRSLTLPSLIDFQIDSDDITFDELVDFLLRHKSIMYLKVGNQWSSTHISLGMSTSLPIGLLPSLRKLELDPSCACHFLASPTSLPNLTTLIIQPKCPRWEREFNKPIISQHLEPLEQCFTLISSHQSITHIQIGLPGGLWSVDWLNSRINAPIERSVERTLEHILRVDINCLGLHDFHSDMDPLLMRWLANFPALKWVGFCLFYFGTTGTLTKRRRALLAGIAKACPTVLSVCIGLEQYDLYLYELDEHT